jgi:glycosyltransferase involved in cell wall biosynthesis
VPEPVPPQKKRITLLAYTLEGGGVQRTMAVLANEFAGKGYNVDLLAVTDDGLRPPHLSPAVRTEILVPRPPLRGLTLVTACIRLAAYLRRARPDALLSADIVVNIVACAASILSGKRARLALTEVATITPSYLRLPENRMVGFWWRLAKIFYPRADRVVAVSKGLAAHLEREIPALKGKVTAIYNPAYPSYIDDAANKPAPHPWLERKDVPVCVAVGRFVAVKGFDNLLRGFGDLRRRRKCRLIIVGDGPLRPSLEALARELGIADDVAMPGFDANPYAFLARADVFAMTSRNEGLGNVLIEALACGCPCVATDCPDGPAEILEQGRVGILVPVDDPKALADALEKTLASPPSRELLKARADDFRPGPIGACYLDILFDKVPG